MLTRSTGLNHNRTCCTINHRNDGAFAMKKLILAFCGLLVIQMLPCLSASADAHPTLTMKVDPTPPAAITPIAEELQKQLQTLVGSTNLTASQDDSDDNATETNAEPAPTIGTQALNFVIALADVLQDQTKNFITNFAALPQFSDWLNLQESDHRLLARWIVVGQDLLNYVGIPFLGALLLELLLFPIRVTLRRRRPSGFVGRLAIVLALFCLRAVPIVVFIGATATLLDQNEPQKLPRFILFNIVYAFSLSRVVITMLRGLFAPRVAALRLLPMSNEQATYSYIWLSVSSFIIICGYFFRDVANAVHVPSAVIVAIGNILGLALVAMMIAVIVQKRAFVASLLRGNLSAAQQRPLPLFQSLRQWLARRWHILTIAYLVIGYIIAALGVANGLNVMLRGTILTVLILILVRLLLGVIDRSGLGRAEDESLSRRSVFRAVLRVVVWLLAVIGFVAAWGGDIPALFATPFGQRILGSVLSITVTLLVVSSLYEALSSVIDRHMNHRTEDGDALRTSSRIRTLLPMIRNILFVLCAAIFALVFLSELGINVAPLLAGAGVLGVAVGFGSQTLVKDFLTGFFIVLENTIAIGDYVKIGDFAGAVESIGFRSLRLRDNDGALHMLPFSEVTKITNMTRDFGYAVIHVGVAYNTDLEHAMDVIREVGDDLQKDPIFKRVILEPVEIWGVDKLGDTSITLAARIRTRPGKHWEVRRMFLLRLKQRFDKEGIEIPFPTVINIHQEQKAPNG